MESSIDITVFDSEFWKPGQCIIKISEQEFGFLFIDKRKRLMKRKPECWIFVDTQSIEHIPKSKCTLFVLADTSGKKNYSLQSSVNKIPEMVQGILHCPPHLFRCSAELHIIFCEKRENKICVNWSFLSL